MSVSVSARFIGRLSARSASLFRAGLLSIGFAIGFVLTFAGGSASAAEPSASDSAAASSAAEVRLDDTSHAASSASSADAAGEAQAAAGRAVLSPRMQSALAYVKSRYKVSREAVLPLFEAVQWIARERGIDPLLIVALISIESGFNAQARSAGGGHGLMQIIPRYHLDKIPDGLGVKGLMDPVVNVKVGAQILDDAIRRSGSTQAGLQSYNGSKRKGLFARRVLAERDRLERAAP